MNKVIEYIIGAKDATGNAIKSALSRIKSFAASVGTNLQNIRAGVGMLQTAFRTALSVMQKSFAFEKMTIQFKTLIGNMDEARAHMKMLKELGDTPPFSLEEFAAASRSLMVMTDGVLGFKRSLELVGDAAAATGQPIQSLAHEVGRAFAIIRDGQPLTRATMALRNMGVLTPEVAQRMQELQDAGATTTQIWEELENALKRYKGAMEETEQTGDGLMGAIKSQWDDSVRSFGSAFMDAAKDGLGLMLEKLKELNENGSIESWAQASVSALETVAGWTVKVANGLGAVWKHLMAGRMTKDEWLNRESGGEAAADAEAFELDREEQVNPYTKKRYYRGSNGSEKIETIEDEKAKRQYEREQELERERLKAIEKEGKLREALAEGQRKIDERNAQKAAEEYEKEYAKALEKWLEEEERERQRVEREVAKERERLWREDLKNHQAALAAAQNEEAAAQQMLAEATQRESQAWGWYRDRDSWKAQLEEERADAAAQKQFDKDFEKLKRFRDWRTANLSDEEEVVRRVALAREEKAAAEEYARLTAESTQRAAEALEKIEAQIMED